MKLKERQSNYDELQNHRSGGNMNSNTFFRDFISAGLAINQTKYILDIGCRTGLNLSELWKLGYKNIHGVDIGFKAEESWKGLEFKDNLIRCDIHDGMPFDINFDIITCSHVLEHCYDPLAVRKIIFTNLKSSGILHSIVPIEPLDNFVKYPYHLACFENHAEHIRFYEAIGFERIYDNLDRDNSVAIFRKI